MLLWSVLVQAALAAPVADCSWSADSTALLADDFTASLTLSNGGDVTGFRPGGLVAVPPDAQLDDFSVFGTSYSPVSIGVVGVDPLLHPVTGEDLSGLFSDGATLYFLPFPLSGLSTAAPDITATLGLTLEQTRPPWTPPSTSRPPASCPSARPRCSTRAPTRQCVARFSLPR